MSKHTRNIRRFRRARRRCDHFAAAAFAATQLARRVARPRFQIRPTRRLIWIPARG
jgi:hypothetical protein